MRRVRDFSNASKAKCIRSGCDPIDLRGKKRIHFESLRIFYYLPWQPNATQRNIWIASQIALHFPLLQIYSNPPNSLLSLEIVLCQNHTNEENGYVMKIRLNCSLIVSWKNKELWQVFWNLLIINIKTVKEIINLKCSNRIHIDIPWS